MTMYNGNGNPDVHEPRYYHGLPADVKSPVHENETVLVKLENLPITKYADEDFSAAVSGGGYLPRIQLMTSNSELCKKGKFNVNNYALVRGGEVIDLGKEVDLLVLGWRPKALEIGEVVISVYDTKSQEFGRIAAKSEGKGLTGAMYGPEFLVWLPSLKEFATYFMCNPTSRREAPNVKSRMLKAATLKSTMISSGGYTWCGPVCVACSTPFAVPDPDAITETLTKFNNPPASEIEKDEDDASARAR